MLKSLQAILRTLLHLWRSDAPPSLYYIYFKTFAERLQARKYLADRAQLEQEAKSLSLTAQWFALHVPFWLSLFEKQGYRNRPIKALEIGSWEGLSSYFLLKNLPQAQLTSVDTWEGSDEHVNKQNVVQATEQRFDSNTAPFASRLTKRKMTSYQFFAQSPEEEQYDLIYVDGSHHADDVMIDALKSFKRLKQGGVMIFDDYFWNFYPKLADNPAPAVNAFLKLKRGTYRVIHVYCQVMIVKTV